MKFYNTLTRKKEDFTTQDNSNTVRMYSCGPTVYNFAHIGNMRTYVFMDLLVKALKYNGYKVKSVMNITDVGHLQSDADDGEDKMATAAKKQQKSPYEIAEFYTKVFFEDFKKLNINRPTVVPKATDHINEMIDIVKTLEDKGFGYEIEDGIYFDIMKLPTYGVLSPIDLEEQIAGARVEVNSGKRHPADFAIWKKAEPTHIMQWQSPWGMGYPGWHIECTAMSKKYLGEVFDIHTGGVDHIPIHHENEIAQSEGLTGKNPAKFWMHGEFMLVDGGKMSKSLGNTYTISDLEKMGYIAPVFRYFCENAHYRKKLNFTFEGMDASKVAYNRLLATLQAHKKSDIKTEKAVLDDYRAKFKDAISDDLNVPLALGILNTMVKEPKSKDIYDLAQEFDTVLGLSLNNEPIKEKVEVPKEVADLAEERLLAKKEKNYAKADELRAKIDALGYFIKDIPGGYEISTK
ncbi:MAG: cysteine--tRNA ligase [Clostridia bacterium]|nr:cysteine--tRNA ligase [Clostridia bacterium]